MGRVLVNILSSVKSVGYQLREFRREFQSSVGSVSMTCQHYFHFLIEHTSPSPCYCLARHDFPVQRQVLIADEQSYCSSSVLRGEMLGATHICNGKPRTPYSSILNEVVMFGARSGDYFSHDNVFPSTASFVSQSLIPGDQACHSKMD